VNPPHNRGGRPPIRIILPDGRQVRGWAAAQMVLGVRACNLRMRADWDDNAGAWKIRPPIRKRFRRD